MDRSVLARKPMTELKDIASHLQMRGYQKLRKAELIDAIVESATGQGGSGRADADPGDGAEQAREEGARKVLPPGARGGDDQPGGGADGEEAPSSETPPRRDASRHRVRSREGGSRDGGDGEGAGEEGGGRDGGGRDGGGRDGGNGATAESRDRAKGDRDRGGKPSREEGRGRRGAGRADEEAGAGEDDRSPQPRRQQDTSGEGGGAPAQSRSRDEDDEDDGDDAAARKRRNRRDRRKRNRERAEQEQQPQASGGQQPGGQQGNEPGEVRAGVLDILPEGYGFLRTTGYLPGERDVYVSQGQIRKHGLRRGDVVQGPIRQQRSNEKVPALHHVQKVNGSEMEGGRVGDRVDYRTLVPDYPSEPLWLEWEKGPLVLRAIDVLAPLGKGQRALLVAPPAAGRTDLLKAIGQAVAENAPEAHLMVVLIDERPEDVTDVERAIPGEVISSTFDHPVEDHAQVAELALERAKRLVELGHDVVILLDSLTRLARAYAGSDADAAALYPAKRFFGAARNIEDGGSLTIIAAALTGSGSRVDELVLEEFRGTANAVLTLDGEVSPHLRPAIRVQGTATRREELLVADEELQAMWAIRRRLAGLPPAEATTALVEALTESPSNEALFAAADIADDR